MKLVSLGSKPEIKIAELTLDDGTKLLFSYGRVVAARIPGKGYIRVDALISKTTERHIDFWCDDFFHAERVPQDVLDALLHR